MSDEIPRKLFYKIGEVCHLTGTQPYVLRFWESEFPQLAPTNSAFGLITAHLAGYLSSLWTFGPGTRGALIGIGMWMALIMAANVWFVIWPGQQKALGLVEADAETKKKAARQAMLFSRFNTMFSIGMLYCMVAQQNAPV